jgi:hypothetical protein
MSFVRVAGIVQILYRSFKTFRRPDATSALVTDL